MSRSTREGVLDHDESALRLVLLETPSDRTILQEQPHQQWTNSIRVMTRSSILLENQLREAQAV
jgi:hypothetical protein